MIGLARVLEPGEQVLFEARARGHWPFDRTAGLEVAFVLGLGLGLYALLIGVLDLLWTPVVLVPAAGLAVALGLLIYAHWRAQGYVVTDRRVIVVRGLLGRTVIARRRTGEERVFLRDDGLPAVEGLAEGPVFMPGLDALDVESIKAALERR